MSPDASNFEVPDDDDDTTNFAPAVEEGPRKDANGLVAFDAESNMAGASAPLQRSPHGQARWGRESSMFLEGESVNNTRRLTNWRARANGHRNKRTQNDGT